MNRKWLLITILVFTIIIIGLILIFDSNTRYNKLVLNSKKWDDIIDKRQESTNIEIDKIKFNDYSLIEDKENNTMYYSLTESHKKYNPIVSYMSNDDVKIAFNESITKGKIESNNKFQLIVYNKTNYRIYNLVVTTLPILSINYKDNGISSRIKSDITLIDNRTKAPYKKYDLNGELNIVNNNNDKKDYTFSLITDSLGNNEREHNISILGLEKHSEYVLNSLNNDSEKIRNVFTTNIWNDINPTIKDSYRYVELFINGSYNGLYSLGYDIEKESLNLADEEFLFYKSKLINSEINIGEDTKLDGYILYDRSLDKINRDKDIKVKCIDDKCDNNAWSYLNNYYKTLLSNDIDSIKNISNIDNSVDIYLFYLFTQSTDHINNETFANTYLLFKHYEDGYKVEHIPYNLNYTFGLSIDNNDIDYMDNSFIMKYNPISRLIELNDNDTILKVKEEYNKLRKSMWSEDHISKLLDSYEKDIYSSGAYLRDKEKYLDSNWISTSIKLDNFKDYCLNRLKYMDKYIESL